MKQHASPESLTDWKESLNFSFIVRKNCNTLAHLDA
jgi:hypothetical protein